MTDVGNASFKQDINQIVDELTLFDDDLMSKVFEDNIPATELILRIMLNRDDIEVIDVRGQKQLHNSAVNGRDIWLDIQAKDAFGEMFNVEVQRKNSGAIEQRARFHSSMMDSRMLNSNQNFKEIKDSYTIFITEKDYFKEGLPIYTINRYIEESDKKFCDGSHIIYVNGTYEGDDEIGRMIKDFKSKNPDDMFYKELATGVKHFKSKGGKNEMCEAVEEFAKKYALKESIKTAIKTAIKFNISKDDVLKMLSEDFKLTTEEAMEFYEETAV